MQVILGSGGAIGVELAKCLINYNTPIKLVSRNPQKVNENDILLSANLLNLNEVEVALKDADVCYLTIGLEYNLKVWQENWNKIIKNVADTCEKYNVKLVFFDNIYALGEECISNITEESSIKPSSKKGNVRADVDNYILNKIKNGNLNAIIARAPDFFGEVIKTSMLMNLCNANLKHSMGYTPELAYGTALLGNTPDAYNQIWNLPTSEIAPTGNEWINLFRNEMGGPDGVMVLSPFFLKILGFFIPVLRENQEMLYQFDRDYYFNSNKFNTYFNYTPLTPKAAVKEVLNILKSK